MMMMTFFIDSNWENSKKIARSFLDEFIEFHHTIFNMNQKRTTQNALFSSLLSIIYSDGLSFMMGNDEINVHFLLRVLQRKINEISGNYLNSFSLKIDKLCFITKCNV